MANRFMESLDFLHLRADECSFLETALTDVRRFVDNFGSEIKKQIVLIFPPFCARNRFLIHTLVQNFFDELNTISIGSSHGRRIVVYHSSLKPMLRETESEESNEIQNEKNDMIQTYRTPVERKAQEQLFKSLMPKKNVDKSLRPNQNKRSKRPDIPIYVPRAMRGLANNTALNISSTAPNISSTVNSSNSTSSTECNINSKIQDPSRNTLCSTERKSSFSQSNLNNNEINSTLPSLDLLLPVDTSIEMLVDCCANNESQNSYDNISSQNSVSSSSNDLSNCINPKKCNLNSSVSNEVVKPKRPLLESDSYIVEKSLKNCDNVSISLDLPMCLSDNLNDTCTQNSELDKLPDPQISCVDNKITPDVRKSWTISQSLTSNVIDNIETNIEENLIEKSEKQNHELNLGNEFDDTNISDLKTETEYEPICPNSSFDDSFSSCQSMEIEEKNINNVNEDITVQENSDFVNKCLNNGEENLQKDKKDKKKKVLDIEECSWEDLYDKDDDYIHPILMKELASTMGKVQVQCTKEDYRNHQTIEERSGDGDCVIELYGFASDLKTIDLMNQFASFRKNHLDIIWVNDTHALAVFENPNLADRALNTPLALVKTRPLKNAIRESKLKAETVAPPPATRPKTCTAMARRLVSSALGLKVDVSPNLLTAERTILANAKDKKIRDNQQKNDIWDSEL